MRGEQLERWRDLCRQIAEEQDPQRFNELAAELLRELEDKKERLKNEPGPSAAAD